MENFKQYVPTIMISLIIFILGSFFIVKPILEHEQIQIKKDFYTYVSYDLMKQREKLLKDPEDIKQTDLLKLNYFCDSYFGHNFITSGQKSTCKQIQNLYVDMIK